MSPRYGKTTGFLLCRTLGHAWDVVDAYTVPRYGGDPVWLRCQRCATERHDAVSPSTGELLGRQYVYDPGYRHAFDSSFDVTPSKSDFRRLMLTNDLVRRRAARAYQQEQEGT
jgi:hypothetical protein